MAEIAKFHGVRFLLASLICSAITLLSGCANVNPVGPNASFFRDEAFAKPTVPVASRDDFFAMSPAMTAWMQSHVGVSHQGETADGRAKRYQRALIDALYDGRQLKIDYDATITRRAAETFDLRAGNCLSLVIMTAAFAKAMDLDVQYRSVDVNETWSRANGMYVAIGHVNITIGKKRTTQIDARQDYVPLTVDFFPPEATVGQRSWPITESTVIAMYMNNRAAEVLADGDETAAYWWSRAAIGEDPEFLPAYNTLGVVYRRKGSLDAAALAFNHVLAFEPYNSKALSNMATVLEQQGRTTEALQMQARLDNLLRRGQQAPFAFFNAGIRHMEAGEYQLARAAFTKELERDPNNDEVNYWQARALVQLGEMKRADDHLSTAIDYSTTSQRRELYAAKRDYLKNHRAKSG